MRKLPRGVSRFTYDTTAFDGFRISISRRCHIFTLYVSTIKTGSVEKAEGLALAARMQLLEITADSGSWQLHELAKKARRDIVKLGFSIRDPKLPTEGKP